MNPTEQTNTERLTERADTYAEILKKNPKLAALVKRSKLSIESFALQHVRVSVAFEAVQRRRKVDSLGGNGFSATRFVIEQDETFVTDNFTQLKALGFGALLLDK